MKSFFTSMIYNIIPVSIALLQGTLKEPHDKFQPFPMTFKTGFICFQVRKLCIDSSHRLSYVSNTNSNGNFNSRKFNCCNFWSEYACRTEIDKLFYENLLLYSYPSYQRVRQHQSYVTKTVWTVNNFRYRNDNIKCSHI